MRKKRNHARAAKVRAMISQGYTTTDICEKLRVRPQAVYNIRWQMKRSLGLGALPLPAAPTDTSDLPAHASLSVPPPFASSTPTPIYTTTPAAPNAALMPVSARSEEHEAPTPKLPFWRRVLAVVALR
jgi:hypothetical protein